MLSRRSRKVVSMGRFGASLLPLSPLWISALLFCAFSSLDLHACSCRPASHYAVIAVPEAAAVADFAFLGEAGKQTTHKQSGEGLIEFTPMRWWKGPAKRPTTVTIRQPGTMCDIHFEPGEIAVIYAFGPDPDGLLDSSTCALMTRTTSIGEEVAILDALDFSTNETWSTDYFAFGCGGGVAARYDLAVVWRDGRVAHSSHSPLADEGSPVQFGNPDPGFARQVFEVLEAVDLEAVAKLNEPAPFQCYFEASLDQRSYRATWGGGNGEPPKELLSLGQQLQSLKAD